MEVWNVSVPVALVAQIVVEVLAAERPLPPM